MPKPDYSNFSERFSEFSKPGRPRLDDLGGDREQSLIEVINREIVILVAEVLPRCAISHCLSTDIRVKTSSIPVSFGNATYGPGGRGPTYRTQVDFLYCESCGVTYFREEVGEIQKLYGRRDEIEEYERRRSPRYC